MRGAWFADATEQGDLLPLTKTEYALGAEARRETGEPHAKEEAQRNNLQGFTCCFAVEYLAGEDHTIERPADYAYWRDFTLKTGAEEAHRLLSLTRRRIGRLVSTRRREKGTGRIGALRIGIFSRRVFIGAT